MALRPVGAGTGKTEMVAEVLTEPSVAVILRVPVAAEPVALYVSALVALLLGEGITKELGVRVPVEVSLSVALTPRE